MKNMKRFPRRLVAAAIALAFMPDAPAANEIGAYVKGLWDTKAVPEVSLVLFRWGTANTELDGKDRMLGQIASIRHTHVTIKMKTSQASIDQYEAELDANVQIYGEGRVASCTECPRTRQYNGTTLVSRGAYNSNICCFDAVFDCVPGVNALDITDVVADGRSVPCMVKFTTQPKLSRLGQKTPIPPKSTLHPASVQFRKAGSADNRNRRGGDVSRIMSMGGEMEEIGNGTASPEYSMQGSSCSARPFEILKDGNRIPGRTLFSVKDSGILSVEGPGFAISGMDGLKQFCAALGTCYRMGKAIEQNASAGHDFSRPTPVSAANFPVVVIGSSGGESRLASLRASLAAPGTKQNGKPFLVVRLDELDRSGKTESEAFSLPLDWIPGAVKMLNPREPMIRLGAR